MAKVRITFNTPDGVWDSLQEAGYPPNDLDEMPEVREAIEKWVEYMEYVTIEIDLKTGEAIVVPVVGVPRLGEY